MTLGVLNILQITLTVHGIEIGVFLILLSFKNLPNLDCIPLLGQILFKVSDILLLFLYQLLLKVLLGLSKLDLIIHNKILLFLEQLFCYFFLCLGHLNFFVFGDQLLCAVAKSIFINVQTLVIFNPWSPEFILADVALKSYLVAVVNKMISQPLDWHRFMELALFEWTTVIYYLAVLTFGEDMVQVVEVRITCLIELITQIVDIFFRIHLGINIDVGFRGDIHSILFKSDALV